MNIQEPAFYVYDDKEKQIVTIGVVIPFLGGVITQSFTYPEWKEFEEKNIPRITQQSISSAWEKWK